MTESAIPTPDRGKAKRRDKLRKAGEARKARQAERRAAHQQDHMRKRMINEGRHDQGNE